MNVAGGVNHIMAWQVVEFTSAADINVQQGSTSLTAGAPVHLRHVEPPAVNVNKTFVLVGYTTNGTGADIGARMLRAQLICATKRRAPASDRPAPPALLEVAHIPISHDMVSHMKTTIEIADALLDQARKEARRTGTTMKELIEQGLRQVLKDRRRAGAFKLRRASYKGRGLHPDVAGAPWDEVRARIYEERTK